MSVNKENIQKVIDFMKADNNGLGFDMSSYFDTNVKPEDLTTNTHWCGTTACIAGYASVIVHGLPDAIKLEDDAYDIGQSFLGITYEQAADLFTPTNDVLENATKEQGIMVLEHLRDTGFVKWSVAGFDEENDEEYDYYW